MNIEKTTNFTIRSLGIQDVDVYDLEVEDTHTFFANDILVHNSNYIILQDLVDKVYPEGVATETIVNFLDKVCEQKLYPLITDSYKDLYDYLNAHQNLMIMEREVIASAAVWTAKKNYFMRVWDNEGVRYKDGKIKIMGMSAIKSSTPLIGRLKLKESYELILDGNKEALIKLVDDFKIEWKTKPIEEISKPSGLKTLNKYIDDENIYIKGATMQAKAALIHNYLINQNKLHVPLITQGSDIKIVPLKKRNPIHQDVVGFVDYFPAEFNLNEYVDYDKALQKNFISYLELVTKKIGWDIEKKATLDDFFS